MHFDAPLPIDEVLDTLLVTLADRPSAVLVAPPGAGKTTRVPLVLMDQPWLGGRKILVLEPRRLAARGAAERMAKTLGERVGERVGLRARLISQTGPRTRIEVITEGVFTRMILDDPALEGVGAVLFDEFHERSLDADLGLALALDAQSGLREDLRILVMSATLDGARVSQLLGGLTSAAPVIESRGRSFPVATHYLGRDPDARIEDRMSGAIARALRSEQGSILAFLPGQAEIRRLETRLRERLADPTVDIAPLYGAMEMRAQNQAIEPAPVGKRKVVLATSIAESSLTIEGVRIVIDCGLARVPRHEPDAGVTRLVTQRVSRASADQRRGRAGRTEPGVCYRLWDEPETASLPAFAQPEIVSADLSGVLLDCAAWGVSDIRQLAWLDPPPAAAVAAARADLQALGALDGDGRITVAGHALRALPLPPRLGHMLLAAAATGASAAAAEIAAVLVERGLGGTDTDLDRRLEGFRRDRGRRAEDMRRLARGWARSVAKTLEAAPGTAVPSSAMLLAHAYPERIARARGAPGQFLLANGRGALLDVADPLARARYLVIAELSGAAAATRIVLAASLREDELAAIAGDRIETNTDTVFDRPSAAVRARRVSRLGAIVISSEPHPVAAGEAASALLAEGVAGLGIGRLPWSKAQMQLRARVAFVRAASPDGGWPDLTDAGLTATCGAWLAPFLVGKTRLDDIRSDDLAAALDALLPWPLKSRLDADAPTHFEAPTGNRHAIDYETAGAPALHIRVQELFGLTQHPAIAAGRLPLTLHLLSPAQRPIQITRDLPGFWRGSWAQVKADMKGRYPKHPWPDDPAHAAPTARAKPRT